MARPLDERREFEQARRARRTAIRTEADRVSYERDFCGSWFVRDKVLETVLPDRKPPEREHLEWVSIQNNRGMRNG